MVFITPMRAIFFSHLAKLLFKDIFFSFDKFHMTKVLPVFVLRYFAIFILNDLLQENTEVEQQIIEQDKSIPDIDTKTFTLGIYELRNI